MPSSAARPWEAGSVASRITLVGTADHWCHHQPADHAGQRALFHLRFMRIPATHKASATQTFAMIHQAMDTSDADVVNGVQPSPLPIVSAVT